MAREEAKVRVRLDTSRAKGELRDLTNRAERTAGRVAGGVRNAVSRGLGVVGIGAGIGAGVTAVRGATESGFGDVVGEALGGLGARISDFFLGSLDEEARAAKSAREETIAAFGAIAGATGKIPPGAKAFFDSVESLRLQEEKGRDLIRRHKDFQGPDTGELIDRILDGIGRLLTEAVDALADKLNPFK